MLNDWSHKVRAILKKYCPGNIKKILPSSQSAKNTRFYFGHQKLCMDNNHKYHRTLGMFFYPGKPKLGINKILQTFFSNYRVCIQPLFTLFKNMSKCVSAAILDFRLFNAMQIQSYFLLCSI